MSEHVQGPAMICATGVMRTGPTRIGRVAGVTLPRTVSIVALGASLVGALLGMALASVVGSDISAYVYGAAFGGGAGWFVVTYSPLRGESLLKWLQLQVSTAARARYIDGERVALTVGVAPLPHPPIGRVRLLRSAVPVPVGQYDERGVAISAANRNLPLDGGLDPLLFAALSLPSDSGQLTAGGGVSLAGRRPSPRPSVSPSTVPGPAAATPRRRRVGVDTTPHPDRGVPVAAPGPSRPDAVDTPVPPSPDTAGVPRQLKD